MTTAPKPTVLIVEDETLIPMVAVEAFLDAGFEVLEAEHSTHPLLVHNGAIAVHILFTDVNMPGEMNGIGDLAEHLKTSAPDICIIITSALPILRAVDHIPATFVTKPYDAEAVSRTAWALLAA